MPVLKMQAKPQAPEMPEGLSDDCRVEWQRVIEAMRSAGTLNPDCGATIEAHVVNVIRMRAADRHIQEHGAIVAAPRTGVPIENPNLRVSNAASRIVLRTAKELGLTPASRLTARWKAPA